MKKRIILRIIGIGLFHMTLYLYIVPFVLYPKFGELGLEFAAAVAVTVSIAVLGTIWLGKKK